MPVITGTKRRGAHGLVSSRVAMMMKASCLRGGHSDSGRRVVVGGVLSKFLKLLHGGSHITAAVLNGATSQPSVEVSLPKCFQARGMDGPVETTPSFGASPLDETLVGGETVADAVSPGIGGGAVVRVVVKDPLVDVGENHRFLGAAHDCLGDESDEGFAGLQVVQGEVGGN